METAGITRDYDDPNPTCARCGALCDWVVCARCGSLCDWVVCWDCGGNGYTHHDCGEDVCCCLYQEDNVVCETCGGERGWWRCLAAREWCEANPLPGREDVERGNVEMIQ